MGREEELSQVEEMSGGDMFICYVADFGEEGIGVGTTTRVEKDGIES